LNSDNGEIGPRSRLYQPEAFGPSGSSLVLFLGRATKKSCCFSPFLLSLDHLDGRLMFNAKGNGIAESVLAHAQTHSHPRKTVTAEQKRNKSTETEEGGW